MCDFRAPFKAAISAFSDCISSWSRLENVDGGAANGSEWRLWLSNEISQGKVTSIPSFNSIGGGFTNDLQQGLLCEAHKQGIRVLDWDTVGSLWSDFNFVRKFKL